MARAAESIATPSRDDFAAMLEISFETRAPAEGAVVRGRIVAIENDYAIVDVGQKTEGRVALKEFSMPGQPPNVEVGSDVEVYVERIENAMGEAVLSRDKARREESWIRLERAFNEQTRVTGIIFGRVKGGFTVDLDGAVAFLPGSQVDVRPMRDVGPLMNQPQLFQILKMDRRRGNIVVSRRAVLEERRAEERSSLVASLQEKQIVEGTVKNITDYGAFVDLGGVDGLLHVTDIAWRRVSHPTEVLSVGQHVTVQIIKINQETQRISLGMKQLQTDPWEGVGCEISAGRALHGQGDQCDRLWRLRRAGAGCRRAPPSLGNELAEEERRASSKIVTPGQDVEVQVLEVDSNKRRISLGLKQCTENPWQAFAAEHPAGTLIEGEVKSITEFGLFVGLNEEIDGMVHLSDIAWDKPGEQAVADFKKGDVVKAKVLDVDVEKERISLGIKQVGGDPMEKAGPIRKGSVVTTTVTEVNEGGIEVSLADGVKGFIRRADLARDRADQRPDRFGVGDKVDALVVSVDKASRKISLSVKAREVAEEKEAVAQYGSTDSGASLGDILGAALRRKRDEAGDAGDTGESEEAAEAGVE